MSEQKQGDVATLISRLEEEKAAAGAEIAIASEAILRFQLGRETYGIPIDQVKGISRLRPITFVPGTPAYVLGVCNQAGSVIPVISLSDLLGGSNHETSRDSRLITIHSNEVGEGDIGILVDRVQDVIAVPINAVEAPLLTLERSGNFLRGQHRQPDGKIVLLLDLPALLRLITNRAGG